AMLDVAANEGWLVTALSICNLVNSITAPQVLVALLLLFTRTSFSIALCFVRYSCVLHLLLLSHRGTVLEPVVDFPMSDTA
ncbi:hypothetical protein XENOCAPTIV_016671, partial [Xenoophorus captivus]